MKKYSHKHTPPLNWVWGIIVLGFCSYLSFQILTLALDYQRMPNVMASIAVGFIGVVLFLIGVTVTIMLWTPIKVEEIDRENAPSPHLLAKKCGCETSTTKPYCNCK